MPRSAASTLIELSVEAIRLIDSTSNRLVDLLGDVAPKVSEMAKRRSEARHRPDPPWGRATRMPVCPV